MSHRDRFDVEVYRDDRDDWKPAGRLTSDGAKVNQFDYVFIFDDGKSHKVRVKDVENGGVENYEFKIEETEPVEGSFPSGKARENSYGHVFPNSKLSIRKIDIDDSPSK